MVEEGEYRPTLVDRGLETLSGAASATCRYARGTRLTPSRLFRTACYGAFYPFLATLVNRLWEGDRLVKGKAADRDIGTAMGTLLGIGLGVGETVMLLYNLGLLRTAGLLLLTNLVGWQTAKYIERHE